MIKADLRQLSYLNKEIALLQKEIDNIGIVRDSVMGWMGKKGPRLTIEGYDWQRYERLMKQLKSKAEACMDLRDEIGAYIDSVDDSLMRSLLRLRFFNHLTWAQIAAEMGSGYSEDQLRMKVERFLAKS